MPLKRICGEQTATSRPAVMFLGLQARLRCCADDGDDGISRSLPVLKMWPRIHNLISAFVYFFLMSLFILDLCKTVSCIIELFSLPNIR